MASYSYSIFSDASGTDLRLVTAISEKGIEESKITSAESYNIYGLLDDTAVENYRSALLSKGFATSGDNSNFYTKNAGEYLLRAEFYHPIAGSPNDNYLKLAFPSVTPNEFFFSKLS
ncbi:MAG: hypothetical protein LBD73_05210 [Deferribacteraceae bacterium]|nr:hypothetical protein [Deferribacteraceae bacterium]